MTGMIESWGLVKDTSLSLDLESGDEYLISFYNDHRNVFIYLLVWNIAIVGSGLTPGQPYRDLNIFRFSMDRLSYEW